MSAGLSVSGEAIKSARTELNKVMLRHEDAVTESGSVKTARFVVESAINRSHRTVYTIEKHGHEELPSRIVVNTGNHVEFHETQYGLDKDVVTVTEVVGVAIFETSAPDVTEIINPDRIEDDYHLGSIIGSLVSSIELAQPDSQ